MKKATSELNDWGRPEYKRSDCDEIVRGKYATTQVDCAELTALLLAVIVEDEGIKFIHQSIGNYLADHRADEWTYEIDNSNQITLRYWLDSRRNLSKEIPNPPSVMTPKERAELQVALLESVKKLKAKVSDKE